MRWLKEFIFWIFDIDSCRTDVAVKLSMTGEPLLMMSKYGAIWQTQAGLKGATVSVSIMQFGGSVSDIICTLNNEYDRYLTSEGKDSLIKKIRERADQKGKFISTKTNRRGTLDFVTCYWSNEDLSKINSLLERYKIYE